MANLINLERVSKSYGVRPLLDNVSLGISVGERVGVVGRNGDGKTTLLEVMTGLEEPDTGRVSRTRGVDIGYLHQGDELVDSHNVREAVLGGREDHEWAADATTRQVVEELLAGVSLDRAVSGCPVASAAAAHWPPCCSAPRADRARRAHQPPRRRGRRLAGGPPRRRRARWSW